MRLSGLSIATMLCLTLLLTACSDPEHDPTLGEPGPNGEPSPAMHHAHSIEFRVTRADYAAALTEFYEFTEAEVFETFKFGDCFEDILADEPADEVVPCIGMYAMKGGPIKAHMTFSILRKSSQRLKSDDFLTCRVDVYVHGTYPPVANIGPNFVTRVDGKLRVFDARVAGR